MIGDMNTQSQDERELFILDWLKEHQSASVVDEKFHDAYAARFPGYKRIEKMFGAQPVPQAQRDLQRLRRSHRIDSCRFGLGGGVWQPGFPTSIVSYHLHPAMPRI